MIMGKRCELLRKHSPMKHEEIEFRETNKQKCKLTKIRKQENIGNSNLEFLA